MKKARVVLDLGGILLVIGLVIALTGWGAGHHPVYLGVVIAVLVALVLANQPRLRRERARTKALVDAAFRHAYAHVSPAPSIENTPSYGFPGFTVTFASKAALEAAANQNEAFKAAMQEIFHGIGPRWNWFTAEKGIFFTYRGHIADLIARARAE